jgi:hypothetical protein
MDVVDDTPAAVLAPPASAENDQIGQTSRPPSRLVLGRRFDSTWPPPEWALVATAALVSVGVVLRFWTHSDMWLDEALTVNISRLPLSQLHEALMKDGAPPLYYFLLHFWMKVFGSSNLGARSL